MKKHCKYLYKAVIIGVLSFSIQSCLKTEEKQYSNPENLTISAIYTKHINTDLPAQVTVALIDNHKTIALSEGRITFNGKELYKAFTYVGIVYNLYLHDSLVPGANNILSIELDNQKTYNCEFVFDNNYVKSINCADSMVADTSFNISWIPAGNNFGTEMSYVFKNTDNSFSSPLYESDLEAKDSSYTIFHKDLIYKYKFANCNIKLSSIIKGTVDKSFKPSSNFSAIFSVSKIIIIK